MSFPLSNPDTRPLPEGWTEHFDSERKMWYYVDLVLEPPRVTFFHPCDSEGKHPSSAPAHSREHSTNHRLSQRPVGPRKSSTASLNPFHNTPPRQRRATVAQQLYASSLNPGSHQSLTLFPPSLRQQSVSGNLGPEDVASSSNSLSNIYSSKKKPVSSTSSPLLNLDHHDPRKVFDCTRMAPGVRRMTASGTKPSTNLARNLASGPPPRGGKGYDVHELYHPSVSNNATPSPVPPRDTLDNHSRQSALSTRGLGLDASSEIQSDDRSSDALAASALRRTPQDIHAAVTEDDLLIVPVKASILSSRTAVSPLDMSLSQADQSEVSSPSRACAKMASAEITILQPKPIRPILGASLNRRDLLASKFDESFILVDSNYFERE